eukprot:CAMPEP_0197529716 /NCGR_PEP_ID=MMETSP1318-20131121/29379_1 /TAXON_ID=552666 /ORGANISM="Partenskyella glossopodia, Strain RCC365" /LENGTH=82 /DNA_ID=CAMNT_0043085291 /DNA_START=796 /DNA_END=1040 /DNA_ORIENTATION=+
MARWFMRSRNKLKADADRSTLLEHRFTIGPTDPPDRELCLREPEPEPEPVPVSKAEAFAGLSPSPYWQSSPYFAVFQIFNAS